MKRIHLFLSLLSCAILSAHSPLNAQIVGTNAFLQSAYLEVGMISNGAYGATTSPANYHPHLSGATFTPGSALALVYDYGHDGWSTGSPPFAGDFTYPGLPFEGWEIQIGAARDQAFAHAPGFTAGSGGTGLTGTITGYTNVGGNKTIQWTGTAASGQLSINTTTRMDTTASWIMTTVRLVNTGATSLPGVYYTRSSDADIDQSWGGGFTTTNWITYQNDTAHRVMSTTKGITTPGYMSLVATDARARAYLYSAWPLAASVDLATVWAGTFASGVYTAGSHLDGDDGMGIVFNLGTINAGDSAIFSYAYIFNDSTGADSVQTSLCGGPLTAGTATPDVTTACPTTTVSFTLPGASAYAATRYQWQSSPDSATWANIPGATLATYSVTGLAATTYYRCIVSCSASGASVMTAGVKITFTAVCPCPGMTAGTANTSVTTACATTSITLSDVGYTASGVTYQWQSSPDSAAWTNIAGATTVPYTFTGISATTYYRLKVICGTSATTTAVSAGKKITFVACACPGITAGTAHTSVATACTTTAITLSDVGYTASGVTYQWQSSPDSAAWTDIAGATTVSYGFTGISATTYYRLKVICGTSAATTAVSAGKKITFVSCSCAGMSAGTVNPSGTLACPTTSITLNDAGYTASGVTYQWQSSSDSSSWTNIAGATAIPYTFSGMAATTYYRLVVTCASSAASVASAGKKITFTASCSCAAISAGTVYANVSSACASTVVILNDAGYTTTGTTVRWQASHDNVNWTDLPVTTIPYTFSGLGATTYYRLKVTCVVAGTSIYSASKLITYISCPPPTTGVSTLEKSGAVVVYPNPVADELTVETPQGGFTSYTITNAVGQQVAQEHLAGSQTKVNVKWLPSGVYYITLKGEQTNEVKKFIKL